MKAIFLYIFFLLSFVFFGISHAQVGPDSEGIIFYTDPESPFPETESDRSGCLARSVVVEIICYVPWSPRPRVCGFTRAESPCNWGTPDVYCCKTQQEIDSLRRRVYARACQKALTDGTCPSNPIYYWCVEKDGFYTKPAQCN